MTNSFYPAVTRASRRIAPSLANESELMGVLVETSSSRGIGAEFCRMAAAKGSADWVNYAKSGDGSGSDGAPRRGSRDCQRGYMAVVREGVLCNRSHTRHMWRLGQPLIGEIGIHSG